MLDYEVRTQAENNENRKDQNVKVNVQIYEYG